jgi:hypothetical protein
MYNSYREIIHLLNLLLKNDSQAILRDTDIFENLETGEFRENGEETLGLIASRYVSFMRGENPKSFPLRLKPANQQLLEIYPYKTPRSGKVNMEETVFTEYLPIELTELAGDPLEAVRYYSSMLKVSDKGIFPFLMWPEVFTFTTKAGENKTILYVFAGQKSGKPNIIPIYCPMLPEQKWTFVAVVIDGRRFNILYNGKIVASKLINEMPRLSKNGSLTSGYTGLSGEISDVKYVNRAMSAEELMIEYTSTSDTRGKPYIDGGSILDIFGCPAGILCIKPNFPPSKGLLSWETPFS